MEFTLFFRGELKSSSSASPAHKQAIRRQFHTQLKDLWDHLPLREFRRHLAPPEEFGNASLIRRTHGFTFAPLVAECIGLVAEPDIMILWLSSPGFVITSGGDIDNRVKTLLDALKVPSEATALPPGSAPAPDEDPFFCLLEDDSVVTRLSVETDRLLDPTAGRADVLVTIRVRTRQLRVLMSTIGMA